MNSNPVLDKILSSLNKQQLKAVNFDPYNALQVIAGPGTGKTKVLTSRVAFLLLYHNFQPHEIIVTTFTNKAAKEVKSRLNSLLKGTNIQVNDLIIGTFHSICLKILFKFGNKIGLPNGWRIAEESEIDSIINDLILKMPDQIRDYANSFKRIVNLCRKKNDTDEWVVNPKMIKKEISKLKSLAILPDEYENDSLHDSALAHFYKEYQEKLSHLNVLDFDDLLMYCFRLLTKERCLPQVKHVLVDEFQDTNSIQMDLMFLLAKGNHHLSRGITVVGDPDQSIYAFRNALEQNFQEMISKCPLPCSQTVLIENYRSSQKILNTSDSLINQQLHGRNQRLKLKAQFDCSLPPVYMKFPVPFLQSLSLAKEILYLMALPKLFNYNDIAILVRQRRQIKNIEAALIEHRIPYKIIKGRAFWESKEIMAMLNLLRCVYSDTDTSSIIKSLLYPSRGFGQTSADKVKELIDQKIDNLTPFETIRRISQNRIPFSSNIKIRNVINDFIKMIDACRDQFKMNQPLNDSLKNIFTILYQQSGLETEYLFEDKRKSNKAPDTLNSQSNENEANYDNPRHKNVNILKKYFLDTNQIEELQVNDTNTELRPKSDDTPKISQSNFSVKEYIRLFFISLSLYTSADNDNDRQNQVNSDGQVTISTIHGAKGLEWPVVFVPGCVEGIIPSIFAKDEEDAEEDDDGSSENEENDLNNEANESKKRPKKNLESIIDEERRMFFVAQTRAKFLLYLSSIDASDSNMNGGGPSRFLTNELLSTTTNDQRLFKSVSNIKSLYATMKKSIPDEANATFSLKTLVEDYSKFIDERREKMIWSGKPVVNIASVKLTRNVYTNSSSLLSDFSTAAQQLKVQNNIFSLKKQYAPTYPTQKQISSSNIQLSPVRQFAPAAETIKYLSPVRRYAPSTNRSILSPVKKSLFIKSGNSPIKSNNNVQRYFKTMKQSNNSTARKEKSSEPTFLSRQSTSSTLSLGQSDSEDDLPLSTYNDRINFSSNKNRLKKFGETTAAEILHNPDDLIIDSRPILTSAKTLVKAINSSKNKDTDFNKARVTKFSKFSKIRDTGSTKRKFAKTKTKSEAAFSQFDIFSQLSKAKKKAKANSGEIIIIDD